jgi:hypothetical protein
MGKQCGNYTKGCMWELHDGKVCGNHIMGIGEACMRWKVTLKIKLVTRCGPTPLRASHYTRWEGGGEVLGDVHCKCC